MDKVMLNSEKIQWLQKILAMAEAKEELARRRLEAEIGPSADDEMIEARIDALYAVQARVDKISRLIAAAERQQAE